MGPGGQVKKRAFLLKTGIQKQSAFLTLSPITAISFPLMFIPKNRDFHSRSWKDPKKRTRVDKWAIKLCRRFAKCAPLEISIETALTDWSTLSIGRELGGQDLRSGGKIDSPSPLSRDRSLVDNQAFSKFWSTSWNLGMQNLNPNDQYTLTNQLYFIILEGN